MLKQTFQRRFKTSSFLILTLSILLSASASIQAQISSAELKDDHDHVDAFFNYALKDAESYFLLKELCKDIGPRLSGSEAADRAVKWAYDKMQSFYFDSVFLQAVKVPHWERGNICEINVVNGKSLEALAIGGSVGTAKGGIRSTIVELGSLAEIEEAGQSLEGKIVFFNGAFDQTLLSTGAGYGGVVSQRVHGASTAAKYGAAAVLVRSASSAYDDVPHTGTLSYKEEIERIPAVCLGVESADLLHDALKNNPKLEVEMELDCKNLPEAQSANVIGELKGSEFPDKIILIGGHLDSWDVGEGAHDDGAGCVQAMGVLRLFQRLNIQPRYTIRAVMFMNEENGLRGGKEYARLAKENGEEHIIAIESDAGGFTPRSFGFTGSDEQLEKMRSWLHYFDERTIAYMTKGGGGADIRPLHMETGTPMAGFSPDTQRLFDLHHSANDVFEAVNRRELEMGTASIAALVYLIDRFDL